MGMSASQARFLQLTARKSDIEYRAQRINFERVQLSDQLAQASNIYNEKISNRAYTFTYVDGDGKNTVDISYKNYKNYMNQQLEGIQTAQKKYFLVSSSGNKIVVANEQEKLDMMNLNPDSDGNSKFTDDDFIICEELDDTDKFQTAIQNGTYYFAEYNPIVEKGEDGEETIIRKFQTKNIDEISTIESELDKTDDAQAQAEYERISAEIQKKDKRMQLELDQLESQRSAIQTEMEAVSKVVSDNVEKTFKIFG